MEQQNKELAEDKVFILYLLNKIFDGIKNDNLYKIVSSSKDINYFYYISYNFSYNYQYEN